MNAADQRRLTPVLGVLCAAGALVLGALALGLGRGVHWGAAGPSASLPAADAAARRASPPLQQFAEVWKHPLFTTDRQPAPEAASGGGTVTLGDLQLTGIILTPDLHMALLHGRSGNDVRVVEGENVASSGWTLVELKPRSAVFTRNGQRTVLKLVVAGDTGASATPAPKASGGKGNGKVMPATAVHPGRAAALQKRGSAADGKGKPPPNGADKTVREGPRQKRIQALKARIESRRRQMQAQQEQGH